MFIVAHRKTCTYSGCGFQILHKEVYVESTIFNSQMTSLCATTLELMISKSYSTL